VRTLARAPLRCLRAFPLAGGERLAQLLHVGPGVMAGDRLELVVDVAAGARALLVAQSAAKLHAMPEGTDAHQTVVARVGAGASLEYHPGLTIPFAGAAFSQRIEVDLEPGARFVMLERWSAGRIARGERHAYRRVASGLRVRRSGRLVYADALVLDPEEASGPAVFDDHAYLASAVRIGGREAPEPILDAANGVDAARYRSGDVSVLRALANDGVALSATLQRTWLTWRVADGLAPVRLERFGS